MSQKAVLWALIVLLPAVSVVILVLERTLDTQKAENSAPAASKIDDLPIVGNSTVSRNAFIRYMRSTNTEVQRFDLAFLYHTYRVESEQEGISLLVALAQMIHETDFLQYTGVVLPEQYNFAGIGAIDENTPGIRFPTAEIGIRAHVQHLKAYASVQSPQKSIVDPRFFMVRRGCASSVSQLSNRWAIDDAYGRKVLRHASGLLSNE